MFKRKVKEKKEKESKSNMQGNAVKIRPYCMDYVEAMHNLGFYMICELSNGDERIARLIINKVQEGEIYCRYLNNVNYLTYIFILDYLDWVESKTRR